MGLGNGNELYFQMLGFLANVGVEVTMGFREVFINNIIPMEFPMESALEF